MARMRVAIVAKALILMGAALGPMAWGLGLGELTPHSALNQPFKADIELLQLRNLESSEIVPKLASAADFERLGVERFFFLTALQFDVDLSDRDHPVIHVTSRRPITEPYLNFVVEVLWPSGRLLKEYTVLLDPPAATPVAAPVVSARTSEPAARGDRVSLEPAPEPRAAPASVPARGRDARMHAGTYGPTDRDDTLWEIALAARPDPSTSVQQTMLEILRRNPEAFIDGNINLLKAGYTLRLPGPGDVRISRADAVEEVARQNVAWQAWRRGERPARLGPQLDAGGRTVASGTPAGGEGVEVRVVAADEGPVASPALTGGGAGGSGAEGEGAEASALAEGIAARDEEILRLQRDNAELRSNVSSLEEQLEASQALSATRDEQIAQLQAQIEELKALVANSAASGRQTPPQPEPSGFGNWLLILLGALIVILLAVVLILWRRPAAQRPALMSEEEDLEATVQVAKSPVAAGTAAAAAVAASEPDLESTEVLEADAVDSMDKTQLLAPEEMPDAGAETPGAPAEEEPAAPETSDVVGEADIYIAYGRFPQAISFLRNALEAEPDRQDIRLKLMEVFVETKDVDAFNAEGAILAASATEEELYRARQLQAKLPGANAIAVPGEGEEYDLDATLIDTSMNVSAIAQAAKGPSLDLDLNLEDAGNVAADDEEAPPLDIDLNLEAQESDATGVADGVDFELDVDLDAEPEDAGGLGGGAEEAAAGSEFEPDAFEAGPAREDETTADELGGDLGFDFDDQGDEETESSGAADAAASLDETLGDFDLGELDLTQDDASAIDEPAGGFEDMESTIEKSIEKQLAERADDGDPFDLDRAPSLDEADVGGADDTSGLDLTIDGRAEPVTPVARPEGGLGADDLDADSDDGLSLTLDGRDERPDTAEDDFNLDELDLDETVSMDGRDEDLDDTIAVNGDREQLDATVQMDDEDLGSDFDLAADADEGEAKLDLARALIDAGDSEGAREVLSELIEEGDEAERNAASELLGKLG